MQVAATLLVLGVLQAASAHGDEAEGGMKMNMDMGMSQVNSTMGEDKLLIWHDFEPSYFRHGHYSGWMTTHILTMIVGWILIMPAAIMLSIARSRYHLPAQIIFHIINGIGIFAGFVYNHATPDLYVVNAHHIMGWVLHAMAISWTILSFCSAFNEWQKGAPSSTFSRRPLLSTRQNSVTYEHIPPYLDRHSISRFSQDSGTLAGSRASSSESMPQKNEPLSPHTDDDIPFDGYEQNEQEQQGFLGNGTVGRMISKHAGLVSGAYASAAIRFAQIVIEKFLILLGFATLDTGFVTYGGIFRGVEVFSGLAHHIKGAIFLFWGLLTLGRWMGAFSEFGWAWNVRPQQPLVAKWKTYVPSAEFTESFVIWLYGASNVFLEHLGASTSEFTAQDFEHISITVLFFGGGLLGMLIESTWLRSLMSTQVELQKSQTTSSTLGASRPAIINEEGEQEPEEWLQVSSEKTSLNPMPALTIMLLGMMMSSHHQHSMVSTMLHALWGKAFSAFAVSRIATYVIMFLRPPTSHFPARPPTELVAAFCLISGGLMFMNSASDSVKSIETNGLDAMTIWTITLGITGLVMAWEMMCFALKGWAIRRESLGRGKDLS